jgi:hypothetical protein
MRMSIERDMVGFSFLFCCFVLLFCFLFFFLFFVFFLS